MELTMTRGFEVALESVPGSALQVHTLLKNGSSGAGSFSKAAITSIIISALTTGFSAATISYE
jgi:hypothetical protein